MSSAELKIITHSGDFTKEELYETNSAEALFQLLQAGNVVKLNQHSLSYDVSFGGLTGTNSYGVDYSAGAMTLGSVELWRSAMTKGEIWGQSPLTE